MSDLAERIDNLIKHVGNYLSWRNAWSALLLSQPSIPGYGRHGDADVEHARQQMIDARNALEVAVPAIVPDLVKAGYDVKQLLTLGHYIYGGGGPDRIPENLWPELKVSLQVFAVQPGKLEAEVVTAERQITPAKQATVDHRMLDLLREDRTRLNWSQRDWADHLRCTAAAVAKTETWKMIKSGRALEAAENKMRRRN